VLCAVAFSLLFSPSLSSPRSCPYGPMLVPSPPRIRLDRLKSRVGGWVLLRGPRTRSTFLRFVETVWKTNDEGIQVGRLLPAQPLLLSLSASPLPPYPGRLLDDSFGSERCFPGILN